MAASTHHRVMRARTAGRFAVAMLSVATVVLAGARPMDAEAQAAPARPAPLTLARLVDPTTRIEVNGRLVTVALHALVRFDTLDDLFEYIDTQAGRWSFATATERQAFGDDLL